MHEYNTYREIMCNAAKGQTSRCQPLIHVRPWSESSYCKEKIKTNQQAMLCERVFSTLKFSTHIWTGRKRSAWQTILSIPCREARSANFFFPAFLVNDRHKHKTRSAQISIRIAFVWTLNHFLCRRRGHKARGAGILFFRAFLVNLRRGHKAQSAKHFFFARFSCEP